MTISYRPMRAKDVRECVRIVETHPIMGPRYGDAIVKLVEVWLGLLGREAFRAVLFEYSQSSRTQIIGVGVSAFISDEFVRSIKTPPFVWLTPELTRRISRGDSPLLSNRTLREENTKGGLNLLVWEGTIRADFDGHADAHAAVVSAFVEQHRGFLLKELLVQPSTKETFKVALRTGGQLLREDAHYVDLSDEALDQVFKKPHYVGMTRIVALTRPGNWVGTLFVYDAPRCGLRAGEQRLLIAAMPGKTDEELAADLSISLSAVKKTWLSIYNRVTLHLPSLFHNPLDVQEGSGRGREKKQRLIAYMREHPEELRPASP